MEEVDLVEGTIRVLGQTIRVPADVIFRNVGSLTELKLNDLVEISGNTGAESLVATYIELQGQFVPGTTELRVRGTIGNINGQRFNIGKLNIDSSNAQGDSPPLSSGDDVEVTSGSLPQSGVLTATQLLPIKPRLGIATGDQISIGGLVSQFDSASAFMVSGIPITTNSKTVFENCSAANLATDSRVIVRGQLDGDVLIASKIVFR